MNFTALRQQESVGGLHDATAARTAATPLAEAAAGDTRVALRVLGSASDAALRRGTALMPVRPAAASVADTTARTRAAVDALVDARVAAQQPARGLVAARRADAAAAAPQFVRYTPAVRGAGTSTSTGSGGALTVQIFERPQDPLEPPKFRNRKVARGAAAEAPAPVLHSPPRRLSAEDQRAWAIPPCVSNWKNNRGYTIPLDKRLAADGRGLQDVSINDGFARLSEALYIAEQNARTELERRAELQREYARREKEQREQALLDIAQQARAERAAAAAAAAADAAAVASAAAAVAVKREHGVKEEESQGSREEQEQGEELARQRAERAERERIIGERRLAREREHRLEAYHGQRGQGARDEAGRDYAEAVALGRAPTGSGSGSSGARGEVLYDQRLFNQSEGVTGGFGADDDYNVYTRPLFADGRSASLYRPRGDAETYGAGAGDAAAAAAREVDRLAHADRFRPERDFAGVDRAAARAAGPRTGPVQFERAPAPVAGTGTGTGTGGDEAEADPFGIGALLDDTRAGGGERHHALDRVGKSGTMLAASASFGTRDTYDASGSGRRALAFAAGSGAEKGADEGKYAPGLTMRAGAGAGEEPAAKRPRGDEHHSHSHSHHSHSHHHRSSSKH